LRKEGSIRWEQMQTRFERVFFLYSWLGFCKYLLGLTPQWSKGETSISHLLQQSIQASFHGGGK
jgi:hypothetical protein